MTFAVRLLPPPTDNKLPTVVMWLWVVFQIILFLNFLLNQSFLFFILFGIIKNNKVLHDYYFVMIKVLIHLISPKTDPARRVTNTVFPSGPPTTCTSPAFMMYISRPTSPSIEKYGHLWEEKKKLKTHTIVFTQTVPFCRHNPQAGKRLSEGSSTCQRSSACHSPVWTVKDKDKSNKDFLSITLSPCLDLPTWKRGTLLTME